MTIQDKIEHCLRKYPNTANSDIRLTASVWYEFYNSALSQQDGELAVKLSEMYKLPTCDLVKRYRAKFNAQGKYIPTDQKVFKQRKLNEKYWHEEFSPSSPSRG